MTDINPALTTNEALRSWLENLHSPENGTGSRDAVKVVKSFFTEDAELTYCNYPVAKGQEVITGFFKMQFDALDGFVHKVPVFDFIAPDKIYQPSDVEYLVRGDDAEKDWIHVKAVGVFWVCEEEGKLKIRKAQMYLDAVEVFSRMKSKGLIE